MASTGNMKIADVLSDLTSLQVCEPAAALALVSARSTGEGNSSSATTTASNDDSDVDLKRAKDLLELHAIVKLAHQDGTDHDLNGAREDVARAMRSV